MRPEPPEEVYREGKGAVMGNTADGGEPHLGAGSVGPLPHLHSASGEKMQNGDKI